jgi:3-oxoacyl-(acyl-carrier-protein) synthase
VAAPDPNAAGAIRAMRWALADARVDASEVDYINAHGTSTPANDKTETEAIRNTFGDHAKKLAISSTKSMIGHLLGASGAAEAIATIMTIQTDIVHPTINYETPDPECDIDCVPNKARAHQVNIALNNSYAFGGNNASLVIKKFLQ